MRPVARAAAMTARATPWCRSSSTSRAAWASRMRAACGASTARARSWRVELLPALSATVPHRGARIRRRSRAGRPRSADGIGAAQRSDRRARRGRRTLIAAAPSPASSCSPTAATRTPDGIAAAVPAVAPVFPLGRRHGRPSAATGKCSASRRPKRCWTIRASISPCRPSATATAPRRSSCGCSRTAGRSKSAAPRRPPTACPFARPFTSRRTRGAPTVYTDRDSGGGRRAGAGEQHAQRARAAARRGRAACCWCRARPASSTASCSAPGAATPGSRSIRSSARARTSRAATRSTSRPVRRAERVARVRISGDAGRAVRVRRGGARQRRRLAADGARSSKRRGTSSAGAAAACWCSARSRSSARG